jgi:hypothetical protein
LRERLAVSKRYEHHVDMERFNVKKLNEGDVKEQHQVTIRNKSSALGNLEYSGDINRIWDNIRENIKLSAQERLGYCESNHRKLWFDEECLQLADRRKQANLQWLQNPTEVNEEKLRDVRREVRRYFMNKEW